MSLLEKKQIENKQAAMNEDPTEENQQWIYVPRPHELQILKSRDTKSYIGNIFPKHRMALQMSWPQHFVRNHQAHLEKNQAGFPDVKKLNAKINYDLNQQVNLHGFSLWSRPPLPSLILEDPHVVSWSQSPCT